MTNKNDLGVTTKVIDLLNYQKRIGHHIDKNKQCLETDAYNEQLVMKYCAGLKAMLEMLPENIDNYSDETIDHYIGVIEILLTGIYQVLDEHIDR